jgi:methionyl-tRNA synthetase
LNQPFYITTPIYYVNDIPHIGTAYCTIAADILARHERLQGRDVFFLTGTDEHGEKIETAASKAGKSPQEFTDEVSGIFKSTWSKLKISFDDFIRTTEERHKKVALHYVSQLIKSEDIYLGHYEGWYCVPDESFWTESQLKDSKCPTCGRDVKKIKEENYFFKISKYTAELIQHIEKNPLFIMPETKRNEVLAFLKEGVRDISMSRTSFSWGIPFPKSNETNQSHVMYVWFDALLNYVTALGPFDHPQNFLKYWGTKEAPNAIHLVGKDILKFHAVYWPCFLLAAGLPLPKRIFAHGWWTIEGQKMSKSLGNAIDPIDFTNTYGQDAFRLFLFREFPFGQDGDFSLKNFKERTNADLANNLGNLVSRTLNLICKNLGGEIIKPPLTHDDDFKTYVENPLRITNQRLCALDMEKFNYHETLKDIFSILIGLNKYIDTKAPWSLAKDPTKKQELSDVLMNVAEGIRLASIYLWPFIPTTAEEILKRLGQPVIKDILSHSESFKNATLWGNGISAKAEIGSPLFPRLA